MWTWKDRYLCTLIHAAVSVNLDLWLKCLLNWVWELMLHAWRMMGIEGKAHLIHRELWSWVLGIILPVTVHRDSVCSPIFEQEKRKSWLSRTIKSGSLGMQVPGTIPCLGTGDDFGIDCYAAFTLIFDYEMCIGSHLLCSSSWPFLGQAN